MSAAEATPQVDWLRLVTAHHEAGHVVQNIDQGVEFDRVTIVPADDYLGAVVTTNMEQQVSSWGYALIKAAGPAAGLHLEHASYDDAAESTREGLAEGYAMDDGGELDLARESVGATLWQMLLAEVAAWTAASWPRITAVADALLASPTGTLTYAECAHIVAFVDELAAMEDQ